MSAKVKAVAITIHRKKSTLSQGRGSATLSPALSQGRGRKSAGRVLVARHAMGPKVSGEALVANDGFSARYDLDRIAGIFSRPAHKLAGQSYVGKVLVLDTAKGGVASAWMLAEMRSRDKVPLAIIFNTVNPILVQGAALSDITMMAGFDEDVTAAIPHGATVEVDPARRTLRVI